MARGYLNRTGEPAGRKSQGNHNEHSVQDQHDSAHDLGHLPLEQKDWQEHQDQHYEQHTDVAAHAKGGDLDGLLVDSSVEKPGHGESDSNIKDIRSDGWADGHVSVALLGD